MLIGIGLSPDSAELEQVRSDLRADFAQTRKEKAEELQQTTEELKTTKEAAKVAVASVISGRLQGKQIAIVLDHEFRRGFADELRAWLVQAGAEVTSTTTITHNFVAMSEEDWQKASSRFLFYPPADTPLRSAMAQALARNLVSGHSQLVSSLQTDGLLRVSSDSTFGIRPDAVLLVGGSEADTEASPEHIDVPLIAELQGLKVRVVGCERSDAKFSCIPYYKALDIPTVDDVDQVAGRLAEVLVLAGAEGHFGPQGYRGRPAP